MQIVEVNIPTKTDHKGENLRKVSLNWVCPNCGNPRGKAFRTINMDGPYRLYCHAWVNPCGHHDEYPKLVVEAASNGLNK